MGKIIFPHLKDYGNLPDSAVLSFSVFIAAKRHRSQYPSFLRAPRLLKFYTYLNKYTYINIYKRVYKGLGGLKKTGILGYWDSKGLAVSRILIIFAPRK